VDSKTRKHSVSLAIPTKDKLRHLRQTLPLVAKIGFDEVIVVDSSTREKPEVQKLCSDLGVKYVFAEADRLRARNLGAELATSEWVCIIDDDIMLRKFDLDRFQELAEGKDFLMGGWVLESIGIHYAWMFRKEFFLNTLKRYDPAITGGDDLDITLRAQKLGKGEIVFFKGLYEAEPIGLGIAKDYPSRWIRNKALYALTSYPLVRGHPYLIKNVILSDYWRLKRIRKGESLAKIAFESFIDRSGTLCSPVYYALVQSKHTKKVR
jgi:glycosyltransferase involved in cell wall biosynthesis